MKTAFTNWKTTAAGFILALGKFMDSYDPTHSTVGWHAAQIIMILGFLWLGGASIDANQTAVEGGTVRGIVKLLIAGLFIFATLQFVGCQTSLEGLSKDQKFEIIKAREGRASIWTTVGSGLAQGIGGAATGWITSKSLPDSNGLRK
jgi:hypothetical protein